ncbi:hypothetical protein [Candidatus Oscillochloris fontis]|uniref:hypothetical protein n=1 Tax=Candidatus Oscillochloris fontis TaxID=2496868 RepID=UPI00101D6317|nr:hypothetical protein [Candidatus Oscillochloris fontis]
MAGEETLAALLAIWPQMQNLRDWDAVEADLLSLIATYRTSDRDQEDQARVARQMRRLLQQRAPEIYQLLITKISQLQSAPELTTRGVEPSDCAGDTPTETEATRNQDRSFLNVRFDGYEHASHLPCNQWLPLVVGVGAKTATGPLSVSPPFAFQFQDQTGPVEFCVSVYGDPDVWEFRLAEDTMLVAPLPQPGLAHSVRDALLLVRAKQTGQQKLYIRVAQKDTGTVVQNLWLYVVVGEATGNSTSPVHTVSISQPLDLQASSPHWVHLIFEASGNTAAGFALRIDARLPDWVHDARYTIPVSEEELRGAAARLRRELEQIVNTNQPDAEEPNPFLSQTSLHINETLMRRVAVALADAGRQIWDMLFYTGKASAELKEVAKRLRNLEAGTVVEIRLENPKFALPWALLYDQPGPITADNLNWSGFWGYRFDLRTLYPGDYPGPVIDSSDLDIFMAFCDDYDLGAWIDEQQSVLHEHLGAQGCTTTIGADSFLDALQQQHKTKLIYTLCYGHRAKQPGQSLSLPAEATVFFSPDIPTRVADLRRLELEPFVGRPLIFMNSCEGVSRDPAHHDDFASYFIADQQARGCIGTEVIVPKLLAHRFALDFFKAFTSGHAIGPTLWQLRRTYLDTYHNILAFNYTLYGNGDIRLST